MAMTVIAKTEEPETATVDSESKGRPLERRRPLPNAIVWARRVLGTAALIIWCSGTAADDLEIAVSPDGFTLQEALVAARARYSGQKKVTVRVSPGTYYGQTATLSWFLPEDTELIIQAGGRGVTFKGNPASSDTWLLVRSNLGRATRLSIVGMRIEHYRTAIYLRGGRDQNKWNGYATIEGNEFYNIGQMTESQTVSYAVVALFNSRHNMIRNNAFVNFYNVRDCAALHAIYLYRLSSDNAIYNNTFSDTCSVPIKFRDFSNTNLVSGNSFLRISGPALGTESFCDRRRQQCDYDDQECPSWGNLWRRNHTDDRSSRLPAVLVRWKDQPSSCPAPSSSFRVRVE